MRLRSALLAIALTGLTGTIALAGLSGMGANIHGNFFSFPKANLESKPVTKITAGSVKIDLQHTRLAALKQQFGGTLQSDGDATWVCYFTDDTATWFISNALGGQEFVMMVAIQATSSMPSDCEEPSAKFKVPVMDAPGLGATTAELKEKFGFASGGSKVTYRNDRPGGYSDVARYLGYSMRGGKVVGLGVGETSIPTTH